MSFNRVRSLVLCVLPLSLPLFAACAADTDSGAGPGEANVGVAAQALMTGWQMPNPVGTGPNAPSYTSASGVVVDSVTGLQWQQTAGCASGCTHADAADYCDGLTLDGHSDWRLPTRIELVSIVDDTRHGPAIDPTAFPSTLTHAYWASTPMVYFPNADNFFKIGGDEGNTAYGASGLNGARCVRAAAPPASSFVVQPDGTVLDTGTGLAWQRAVPSGAYTQSDAIDYCDGLGSGWRLPSMKELQTIVDDTRTSPAIDTTAFPSTPTDVAYWTSTAVSWQSGNNGWHVGFNIGQTNHSAATDALHVRCVADGDACHIGGSFYAAGAVNPSNACEVCAPGTSTTAWSNGPNGTACGSDQACTSGVCAFTLSVSIREECGSSSAILETIAGAAGCVNFAGETISAGASYATLNGSGSYTLYEGADCTGGSRQTSTNTYFCGTHYDNGHGLNDNARSISFP